VNRKPGTTSRVGPQLLAGRGDERLGERHRVTILVYAWDPYAAAWPAFCHGLTKYWPDCPFEVVFLTNRLDPPCGRAVKVGDENDFFRKISAGLDHVGTPFLLFMHDDYWIRGNVDTTVIFDWVNLLDSDVADYVRLRPQPPADREFAADARLGVIDIDAPYRLSMMASLWRMETLRSLLRPGESLWQLEVRGSERSRSLGDRMLCVRRSSYGIPYVSTAIQKGVWTSAAFEYVRHEGLVIDFDDLPARSLRQSLRSVLGRTMRRLVRRARG